ncbi:glycoside hydrolase family 2 protein [Roseibium denhamense]|uniref:Beta-mannosidase n=1 Tax=Roseibium denhamense TaxID=76305 RepID=A0ABY1PJA9_9HYPH|nr:glycoside hydrolase family 2 protein [Roseibium denhamense]MTI05557.1 glycoside hydrolase family 2 protein [Roseibium denhamense]SMP34949.1 beta-mannosidase [Roseibium denhamense]
MSQGSALEERQLTDGWQLMVTEPGAYETAFAIEHGWDWVDAKVPGTAAQALRDAGRFDRENPVPLHSKDVWYKCWFTANPGTYVIDFSGLATVAEIYVNDERVLETANMFRSYTIMTELTQEAPAANTISICFRALEPLLAKKGPRARWKPQLANSQGLRLFRTTLLGRMPGWCPEIHPVGPYRPIVLRPVGAKSCKLLSLQSTVGADGSGVLSVAVDMPGLSGEAHLVCGTERSEFTRRSDGKLEAGLKLGSVQPWMPHTHGTPALYDVVVEADGDVFSLGKTGFRSLQIDRGPNGDAFGLVVNDVPVFARGAVWTNADIIGLRSDRDVYRPLLEAARDAGMNMLRIGGTMLYESRAFFELCDELGILVWQDFQFANYDYPVKDEQFVAEVSAEVADQLSHVQGCPSLGVLCGGSEIYQQGAMMGLPEARWKGPLCEDILPPLAATHRPDVPYVANSPMRGVLPFSPNEGVAHYYGVGAYLKPLDDARRADVKFASECLAFSNIPDQATLDRDLPVAPSHDPRWKQRVPRDRGAGWDFEDVRDHYLKTLYGVDPLQLRYGDPAAYLDLGRAVVCDVMEQTFAEWRRAGSNCRGGLVWTYQDLLPGAGWGVVDPDGAPKPVYFALKRAFRPLQLAVTDEGTNGLAIHLINELPEDRPVTIELQCYREGKTPVVSGSLNADLEARSAQTLNAAELIGAFFDVTYAYRFGPPSHDVASVRILNPETGLCLAETFHFTSAFSRSSRIDAAIEAEVLEESGGTTKLAITSDRFLWFAHFECPGLRPSDNWTHIAPGKRVEFAFEPGLSRTHQEPPGSIRLKALNLSRPAHISL